MKFALFLCLFVCTLFAESYAELTQKIIRELNYIYQDRSWDGGTTFAKATSFRYRFKALSDYEIEITRSINGVCAEEPFIIDLRQGYYVQLEKDNKCNPALIISHELDIIYKETIDVPVLVTEIIYRAGLHSPDELVGELLNIGGGEFAFVFGSESF